MSEPKYLVWDVESTGIDVFNDRIVQLVISTADADGNILETWEWIIDPGIEVPKEASEVHGFTTEYLRENGELPVDALTQALSVFEEYGDLIWVAYNLNYDASILGAEFKRHDITGIWDEYLIGEPENPHEATLFDPLVVDRAKDKYRKGKRKLENVATHYGVPFNPDEAHKADYDVKITAKVAAKVAEKYGIPSNEDQAQWYHEWATHLQEYLRRTDPEADVNPDWPLRLKENE